MARYPGNIRKFPTTNPTQSSAPGVWTMSEQIDSQRRGIWPTERDPYYNYTALHIPGNIPFTSGPNSINKPLAYNSDASPNNFNIVQNGDVRATNFHPYQNNFSGYFNGASKLVFGSSTAWTFGTGDFTVEYWLMLPTLPSIPISFIDMRQGGASTNHVIFQLTASAGVAVYIGSTPEVLVVINNILKVGQWAHIANVRESGVLKVYCNGVLVGKTACTTNVPPATPSVGGEYLGANYLTGYISNLRVSKSARYNNNFTPPTSRLSSEGASILALTDNRFIDQTNNTTISVNTGSPQISSASPFVEYDTTSGSGYFQGSTSVWLNAPDNAALELSSNDFTIECWVYSTADFSSNRIFTSKWNNFVFGIIPTPVLYFAWYGNTNGSATGTLISTALNVWHHFAVCRQGNTLYMFQNGQKLTQSTSSITSTLNNDNYGAMIGGNESVVGGVIASANEPWYGYISDYRFVNGTALYTSSFTLPTRPLTAVSNTSLLTLQTRAPANNNGFIDSSPNNFLITRNGNTTQGSFSPFSPSGWSNYFAGGNSDYLQINSSTGQLAINGSDFTIEFWFMPTANTPEGNITIISNAPGVNNDGWYIFIDGGPNYTGFGFNAKLNNVFVVSFGTALPFSLPINSWTHLALTKSGSTFRSFCNGQLINTVTNSASWGETNTTYIGQVLPGNQRTIGNISNLRIVKGTALYTSTFTPSNSNLTAVNGTILLTCQDNRFVDKGQFNFTVNRIGNISVQPLSPFTPTQSYIPSQNGGSSYYDSSGDYLSIASNPALNFSGDFCIEGWAYPTSSNFGIAYKYVGGNVGSSEWYFVIDGTWQLSIALDGGGGEDYFRTSSNTITPYAWNHCVVTRSGTAVRLFINGILQSYNTTSRTLNATGTQVVVGGNTNFLSGVRITKDTIPILYQTSHTSTSTKIFDPPTSPPTAIPGTSLLLNFTNGALIDATGRNNIETYANSQLSKSVFKWNSEGSIVFDGTGDYTFIRSSPVLFFGTSNWTIETWINLNTAGAGTQRDVYGFNYNTDLSSLCGARLTISPGNYLQYLLSNTAGNGWAINNIVNTNALSANTWYYVALVRSGNTIYLYLNNELISTASFTTTLYDGTAGSFIGICYYSSGNFPGAGTPFYGNILEVRVTKGIARNVSSIPTRPFALA